MQRVSKEMEAKSEHLHGCCLYVRSSRFLNVAEAQCLYNTRARVFSGLSPMHTMANPAGPGAGSRNAPGTASAPQIPLPPASVTLSSDHHLRRPSRPPCAGPRETPYPWEKWSADIQRRRSISAARHEAVEYWHQDLSKTFEECFKVCLDSRGLGGGGAEEGKCSKGAKSLDQRPGTASREEHKSAHMLPSPPQMPPPIELRIENCRGVTRPD